MHVIINALTQRVQARAHIQKTQSRSCYDSRTINIISGLRLRLGPDCASNLQDTALCLAIIPQPRIDTGRGWCPPAASMPSMQVTCRRNSGYTPPAYRDYCPTLACASGQETIAQTNTLSDLHCCGTSTVIRWAGNRLPSLSYQSDPNISTTRPALFTISNNIVSQCD
jgi:hypothetical protein